MGEMRGEMGREHHMLWVHAVCGVSTPLVDLCCPCPLGRNVKSL